MLVLHPCPTPGLSRATGVPGALGRPRCRWRDGLLAAVVALIPLVATVSVWSGTAGAGINTDKTQIAQLEARIAEQGDKVQTLVSAYDQVDGHLLTIRHQIAGDRSRLSADTRAQAAATVRLRHWAINAYISAISGNAAAPAAFTRSADASTVQDQQVYLGVASGSLDSAVATLQIDQYQTNLTQHRLETEQSETVATLRQLGSAQQAAQSAVGGDDAILSQVKGNLLALVTELGQRRQATQEKAQEAALAAQEAQNATTTATPPPPPSNAAPGSYANPLRAINGLTANRIDQGVDYGGFGPIYALGDGVVLSTYNSGWPGGTFLSYQLSDGPAAGLVAYFAESIDPTVQVGQHVTSGTVLGQVYEGGTGIEVGWCDTRADGTTLASDYAQFNGYNSSAFGLNFSQLLSSLGAPGGQVEGGVTGSLPAGWPSW